MTRLKELLKDKKVVTGVAVVLIILAVGTTVLCVNFLAGNKNKQESVQETQQQTTAVAVKNTEKTTAAMEIAQLGTDKTTAAIEENESENESSSEETAEADTQAQTKAVEEAAKPEENPNSDEAVSENTGIDTEESNEPEVAEDTGSSEPEETSEPTQEPETEAAPSLTDEERLVATGKWEFNGECDMPRGHRVDYGYTDSITGYTIYSTFINGKYSGGSSNGPEEIKAIFNAHGISDSAKMTIDTMLML